MCAGAAGRRTGVWLWCRCCGVESGCSRKSCGVALASSPRMGGGWFKRSINYWHTRVSLKTVSEKTIHHSGGCETNVGNPTRSSAGADKMKPGNSEHSKSWDVLGDFTTT